MPKHRYRTGATQRQRNALREQGAPTPEVDPDIRDAWGACNRYGWGTWPTTPARRQQTLSDLQEWHRQHEEAFAQTVLRTGKSGCKPKQLVWNAHEPRQLTD